MIDKLLETAVKNSEHLVFNNFIESQTLINLLSEKGIISTEEFEKEKTKIVKGMIVEGISKGIFSERISELFKNQLERLNASESKGA